MSASDRGFALLIVAIALAALSLIFAAAIGTTRQHLAATTAQLARVRLLAAIDGAITTVSYDLVTAREIAPKILDAPQTLDIGNVPVEVSARPEASKLDLNTVAPALLDKYFVVSGLSEGAAKHLTEEILERRKQADPVYAKTHDETLGEPFESVSEIFALVSEDVGVCIEPDLTVFTGLAGVSSSGASPRLRAALSLPARGEAPVAGAAAMAAGRSVVAGEIFEVTARAHSDEDDVAVSRQVVLRVTGNRRTPIWTLSENTPALDPKIADAACEQLKQQARTADNAQH